MALSTLSTTSSVTYDHRLQKTRDPVRSPRFKLMIGGVVLRWETTGEYPLLYVYFLFALSCFVLPCTFVTTSELHYALSEPCFIVSLVVCFALCEKEVLSSERESIAIIYGHEEGSRRRGSPFPQPSKSRTHILVYKVQLSFSTDSNKYVSTKEPYQ